MYKIKILALAMLFAACGSGEKQAVQTEAIAEEPEQGYQLKTLDGEVINLEDYQGKTVVLNLWATWCKPCIIEMPSFERLQGQLSDDYVFLFASNEKMERIQGFIEKRDFQLDFIWLDGAYEVFDAYSLPTTLIYGPDGSHKKTLTGSREWDDQETVQLLTQIQNP